MGKEGLIKALLVLLLIMLSSGCASVKEFLEAWEGPCQYHYDSSGRIVGKTYCKKP